MSGMIAMQCVCPWGTESPKCCVNQRQAEIEATRYVRVQSPWDEFDKAGEQ